MGGEDFDNRILTHFCKEFHKKHGIDLKDEANPRSLRRLRTECERIKRVLSTAKEATLEIYALHDGIDFLCTLSRAKFEEICDDLFTSTLSP